MNPYDWQRWERLIDVHGIGGARRSDGHTTISSVQRVDAKARCGFCGKRRSHVEGMAEAPMRPAVGKGAQRDHAGGLAFIRDYDFHPPRDLRLFPMPKAGVLRFDDEVFIAQVRYGDVVVRHHAWRDRWFKINCTTDLRGQFIETTAPGEVPPFTFNCDVATPMVRRGDAVFAVDLWLDVLVRGEGVTHGVYDDDEFDDAISQGWLSEYEQAGARAGLDELLDLIDRHALIDFLAEFHLFVAADVPESPAMERVELGEADRLRPGVRASW